jgi:NDP-sugar pyrophosphorylase family protein
MKAGIIAAGLGERLRAAGILTPKPLIAVGGKTLLERAIHSACEAGAEEIAVIVNAEHREVERYVRERRWPVAVQLTVGTTPSSMESFFALQGTLGDSPFLLLTVDAVYRHGTLARLAEAAVAAGPAGTLAVTRFVDDEKPLRAAVDERGKIAALGDRAATSPWVTSGVYFFFPVVYSLVTEARDRKLGALRQFLALLLEKGHELHALAVEKSIDVDRPQDIAAAEEFVNADD